MPAAACAAACSPPLLSQRQLSGQIICAFAHLAKLVFTKVDQAAGSLLVVAKVRHEKFRLSGRSFCSFEFPAHGHIPLLRAVIEASLRGP